MRRFGSSPWLVSLLVPALAVLVEASHRYLPWWQVIALELILLAVSAVWIRDVRRVYQARQAGTQTGLRSAWWRSCQPVLTLGITSMILLHAATSTRHTNVLVWIGAPLSICGSIASLVLQARRQKLS